MENISETNHYKMYMKKVQYKFIQNKDFWGLNFVLELIHILQNGALCVQLFCIDNAIEVCWSPAKVLRN